MFLIAKLKKKHTIILIFLIILNILVYWYLNQDTQVDVLKHQTQPSTKFKVNKCNNLVEARFNKSVWTLLSKEINYVEASIKLLKSIRKHTTGDYFDAFIIEIEERKLTTPSRKALESAGWKICTVDRIPPPNENRTHPHFRDQFTKLILWSFDQFDSIIYFDSDTLVINNIDHLLNINKKVTNLCF